MRTIKTYSTRAPFYNALIGTYDKLIARADYQSLQFQDKFT
jgi:hypothetical protein